YARFNHIVKGTVKRLRGQGFRIEFVKRRQDDVDNDVGSTLKDDDVFAQAWVFILGYANGQNGYPNDSGRLTEWASDCEYDEGLIDSYVRTALNSDMVDWARKVVTEATRGKTYHDEMGDPGPKPKSKHVPNGSNDEDALAEREHLIIDVK